MSVSSPGSPSNAAPAGAAWPPGPHEPHLEPGAVHVWRAELTASEDELAAALSAEERERAQDLAGERERARWRRSREVLRGLLGRYLAIEPAAVELRAGANAKPELATHERDRRPRLFFNLAHSHAIALYAFTTSAPIGIDVQLQRDREPDSRSDRVALARRVWGEPAARRLAALAPDAREREFLRIWTRFEADCKRTGEGIGAGVARARRTVTGTEGSPWIEELDVGPRAAAAVACERAPRELSRFDWR